MKTLKSGTYQMAETYLISPPKHEPIGERTLEKALYDYELHGICTICGNGRVEKLRMESR